MAEHCSTICSLIIKTVQNDNPCIISFLYEFTKGLHKSNFKIYSNLCVQRFHSTICWFSKMKFGVIHLETCGSTQPCVALWTSEFLSCFFVYGRTYMALNADIE
jgi:hypothetical protein